MPAVYTAVARRKRGSEALSDLPDLLDCYFEVRYFEIKHYETTEVVYAGISTPRLPKNCFNAG